jgi:hypothetical protein
MNAGCATSAPEFGGMLRTFQPGPEWTSVDPSAVVVPGDPLAAWTGPEECSLAIFRALPIPRPDAGALLADWANRLTGFPETRVLSQEVIRVRNRPAFRLEAVALGTGSKWAATSLGVSPSDPEKRLIPTRRVLVGIPEREGTYYVQWTYPERGQDRVKPAIEQHLRSLGASAAGAIQETAAGGSVSGPTPPPSGKD